MDGWMNMWLEYNTPGMKLYAYILSIMCSLCQWHINQVFNHLSSTNQCYRTSSCYRKHHGSWHVVQEWLIRGNDAGCHQLLSNSGVTNLLRTRAGGLTWQMPRGSCTIGGPLKKEEHLSSRSRSWGWCPLRRCEYDLVYAAVSISTTLLWHMLITVF